MPLPPHTLDNATSRHMLKFSEQPEPIGVVVSRLAIQEISLHVAHLLNTDET